MKETSRVDRAYKIQPHPRGSTFVVEGFARQLAAELDIEKDRVKKLMTENFRLECVRDFGSALISAALNIESWLSKNVGETTDWPVHLHVDNVGDADALAALLTDLTQAAKEYRENM